MRPNLKTLRVNDRYLVGANTDLHVIAVDPDSRSVVFDADLQADCMDCFHISQDGDFLAAAFALESLCCVEVIDLRRSPILVPDSREAATILRIDRVHALDVRIAPFGEALFYRAHGRRSGTYAVHLPSGQPQALPNTITPSNGAWLTDQVVLPNRRGRGGVCISYRSLTVSPIELPSKSTIWQMIAHPSCETVAMITAGRVASLRADTLEPLWERRIPQAGWISYSGDGRFVAVQDCAENGGFKSIILLNSNSGETVLQIDEPDRASFPLDGSRFLCYSGRFLDAETGELEEGVSAPGFWKEILARRR